MLRASLGAWFCLTETGDRQEEPGMGIPDHWKCHMDTDLSKSTNHTQSEEKRREPELKQRHDFQYFLSAMDVIFVSSAKLE